MGKAVWAFSADSPSKTCEDAKYLGDGRLIAYPGNPSDKGQPGWDIGLGFDNFADLTQKTAGFAEALRRVQSPGDQYAWCPRRGRLRL